MTCGLVFDLSKRPYLRNTDATRLTPRPIGVIAPSLHIAGAWNENQSRVELGLFTRMAAASAVAAGDALQQCPDGAHHRPAPAAETRQRDGLCRRGVRRERLRRKRDVGAPPRTRRAAPLFPSIGHFANLTPRGRGAGLRECLGTVPQVAADA